MAPRSWSFVTAPDGVLTPGASFPTITGALRMLRIAVGLQQATADDRNHADVAPLGLNGRPTPDNVLYLSDALNIPRKVVGLINFQESGTLQ